MHVKTIRDLFFEENYKQLFLNLNFESVHRIHTYNTFTYNRMEKFTVVFLRRSIVCVGESMAAIGVFNISVRDTFICCTIMSQWQRAQYSHEIQWNQLNRMTESKSNRLCPKWRQHSNGNIPRHADKTIFIAVSIFNRIQIIQIRSSKVNAIIWSDWMTFMQQPI